MFYSTCSFLGIAVGLLCYGAGIATAPREGWIACLMVGSVVIALGFINLGLFIVKESKNVK